MVQSGHIVFGRMEGVLFGRPAAEAVAEEARRLAAERVFLMVSGTLTRDTDGIEKLRRGLGGRCAGVFARMPPHTPRRAVIEAAAEAREVGADLIATVGGGSVTDGAKAVQLCLANDIRNAAALDDYRPVKGPDGALGPPPCTAPSVRQITVPTTLSGGEFSAIAGGIRAVDHCVEGLCSGEANPFADAQALHGLTLLSRGSRPTRPTCRPGSIARSAPGCRWGRSRQACRWAPATASAMCSAPPSTFRTGTPRASCCRR
jgi:maleylacetate reductase